MNVFQTDLSSVGRAELPLTGSQQVLFGISVGCCWLMWSDFWFARQITFQKLFSIAAYEGTSASAGRGGMPLCSEVARDYGSRFLHC